MHVDEITKTQVLSKQEGVCRTKPPVLIVGVMNRCGSNFLADALSFHPDFQIPAIASEDYLLESADLLQSYVQGTTKRWNKKAIQDDGNIESELIRRLGGVMLGYLEKHISSDKRLLLKTPRPFHLELAKGLLGKSKILFLLRDGRDVAESAARSFKYAGHDVWMKRWAQGASEILGFTQGAGRGTQGKDWMMIRYEQLFKNTKQVIGEVLEFVEADHGGYNWDALEKMPLRGSSTHRGGKGEIHWSGVDKPKDFQPVGRWHCWGWWRKRQFKRIAGRQLIELGYESDNRW